MVHSVSKPKKKMPRILGKKLQFCFSKPEDPISTQFTPTPFSQNDHNPSSQPSTSSSNMKKLQNLSHIPTFYDLPSCSSTSKSFTPSTSELFSSDSDSESLTTSAPPDFTTIFASRRFFISSPGRSNSIFESNDSKEDSSSPPSPESIAGGIPIRTYSPDPYIDFRQSMVEMVEARELFDVKADWNSLHELLLCYLALNPKDTHKCIIAAFTDVLITLTSSESLPTRRKSDVSDYCSVSSRLV
ncbi:hypothetical protein AQUCO_01700474v1 [Aquilegia coerulea]|uniref:Transcription repressor n=1 Tax=Aquilegia coerulea TaxID=218851 RepID=A0A2G5DN22_AQUCA|nr:hypothetical protein AQUCO_01700474v1 [Aquilegia coerulea]